MNYEQLIRHLLTYFSDTSRNAGQTKSGLLGLIDEARMLIESIEDEPEEDDE